MSFSILVFLMARYVDETNTLIDPSDGWTLPGGERVQSGELEADLQTLETTVDTE